MLCSPIAAESRDGLFSAICPGLLVLGGSLWQLSERGGLPLAGRHEPDSPGSHCPSVQSPHPLVRQRSRARLDHLGGHCRDCREPISMRYPLVEALSAGLFMLLEICEPLCAGATCRTPRNSSWRNSA